jgi:hypothetical protein
VLGEAALADTEHLVPGLQRAHPRTDRFDAPGDLPSPNSGAGTADAIACQAYRVGQSGHQVPDAAIDAGRVHTEQHLVVPDLWTVDLLHPQDILGLAVLVLPNRRHPRRRRRDSSEPGATGALWGCHHDSLRCNRMM